MLGIRHAVRSPSFLAFNMQSDLPHAWHSTCSQISLILGIQHAVGSPSCLAFDMQSDLPQALFPAGFLNTRRVFASHLTMCAWYFLKTKFLILAGSRNMLAFISVNFSVCQPVCVVSVCACVCVYVCVRAHMCVCV
eukprot:scpid108818/ scgid12263/ 